MMPESNLHNGDNASREFGGSTRKHVLSGDRENIWK